MAKKKKIPAYNFKAIEKRWQKYWEKEKLFQLNISKARRPFYNLMMFPYPSAEGLHVGGVFTFTGVDTFGRYKKLQGFDVFEPIGLDGFGIHSENYAMKIGEHIRDVSRRTEKNFYRQLRAIGNMYDWSRTVETYKPNYYKWTQWLFLQLYKKGLAYRKQAKVNWCPWCKTVLSDEQVIAGRCERCDSLVKKKELNQWFFKITNYADRLLKNLKWIDWPEDVKINQRNWIGKSEGAIIRFEIKDAKEKTTKEKEYLEVFTTRPDTLFGATYLVLAPEHHLFKEIKDQIRNKKAVLSYIEKALNKTEQERKAKEKDKTGIELKGVRAINPATKKEVPIWVADYVLMDYGTGAIMAVPAHDKRDFEFAKRYKLPIKPVVRESNGSRNKLNKSSKAVLGCFTGEGVSINSGFLNGLETEQSKQKVIKWLEKNGYGKRAVDYKLRDWCISRQRYWGPPIPIVWCQHCALQQKPVKVLIIHGFEGSGKGNWLSWIKEQLEKIGCEVLVPSIKKRDSSHPTITAWIRQLKPYLYQLDENSIIISHSLGSKAALHLLERNNKKIAKLFLVASAIGNPKRDWDWLAKKWRGSDIEALRKFWEKEINWRKIKGKAKESHIIVSRDDNFIDTYHYKITKLDNLQVEIWNGFRHFQRKREPALLQYILRQIDSLRYSSKQIVINFYDNKTWQQILRGQKTVETRALNPNEADRFFGGTKVGDKLILRNIKTLEERAYVIKNQQIFKGLADLARKQALLKKIFPEFKKRQDRIKVQEIKNKYEKLEKGYLQKIQKNGLIAWEIEEAQEAVPVPEDQLPVKLPPMEDFLPEGKGKGPLAKNEKFVKTKCPICGQEAKRETDVSDPFVDSSWYFFRYPSTEFDDRPFDKRRTEKWLPVDSYIGGKEHTVLHLLYSRFITMVLKDLGYINFEEPYKRFFGHGLITKDGAKMSKSRGNVVNPDEILEKYGADTMRMYLRFVGDFAQGGDWRDSGIDGMARFVKKTWRLFFELEGIGDGIENLNMIDKTIKVVGEDIERLSFNTAVARIMEFINWIKEHQTQFNRQQSLKVKKTLALLLAPMMPHLAEEFWSKLGYKKSIFTYHWPKYNPQNIIEDEIELVVQVNGKVRDKLRVPKNINQAEAEKLAQTSPKIKKWTKGRETKKVIFVPNRLINIVM